MENKGHYDYFFDNDNQVYLDKDLIMKEYQKSKRSLIVIDLDVIYNERIDNYTDYDTKDPPESIITVLAKLCMNPTNLVYLITNKS